jgi:hypothetical protein
MVRVELTDQRGVAGSGGGERGAVGGKSEAHHWQRMPGPSFTQHWLVLGCGGMHSSLRCCCPRGFRLWHAHMHSSTCGEQLRDECNRLQVCMASQRGREVTRLHWPLARVGRLPVDTTGEACSCVHVHAAVVVGSLRVGCVPPRAVHAVHFRDWSMRTPSGVYVKRVIKVPVA